MITLAIIAATGTAAACTVAILSYRKARQARAIFYFHEE